MPSNAKSNIALWGLLGLLLLFPASLEAELIRHVIDGDTVIMENDERVRLIGIDAPEIDNPRFNKVGEFFGDEATDYLRERVEGRRVSLEPGPEPYDRYNRRLATIYLDGVDINAELVEKGYAEAIRFFEYDKKEQYLALERAAREKGLGMWNEEARERFETGEQRDKAVEWGVISLIGALAVYLFWKRV